MLHTPSLEEVLRSTLDPAPAHPPAPGDRLAAVLAPVVESPGPSLIFTVRSDALSRHPGEVSFPGGLVDEGEALAVVHELVGAGWLALKWCGPDDAMALVLVWHHDDRTFQRDLVRDGAA